MFENMPFPAVQAGFVDTWTSLGAGCKYILRVQAVDVRVPGSKTSPDGRGWAIFRMDQEWKAMGELPCGDYQELGPAVVKSRWPCTNFILNLRSTGG